MKQRLSLIFGVFFISLILVGLVQAFTMGNVDGQWSPIEYINDTTSGAATNDYWASGPPSGSTDFDDPEFIYTFYEPQSYYGLNIFDDWNQVRYGIPAVTDGGFADQSGFGFDGVDFVDDILDPYNDVPFLLGKFCHFNNPIDPPDNPLEWVNLDFHIENVYCDPTANSPDPFPDGLLKFSYRFTLDETPNSPDGSDCEGGYAFCPHTLDSDTYCPYQTGVNSFGCADRVDIGGLPITDTFICDYGETSTEYKISVLGLIPMPSSLDNCPSSPSGDYSFSIISGEEADNCACLYGTVTEVIGTLIELNSFTASFLDGIVYLEWETASEINNLGFNIYRGSSDTEIKEKINNNIIPSLGIGGTSGENYTYMDDDSLNPGTYFYFLESIDIDYSPSNVHGPVEVHIEN